MSGRNEWDYKESLKRLVEILLPYGTLEDGWGGGDGQDFAEPRFEKNRWILPMEGARRLSVEVESLPEAMGELLELYLSTWHPVGDAEERQQVTAWLAGDLSVGMERVGEALWELRWPLEGACFLLIEFAKETEERAFDEVLQLLGELVVEERAFFAVQRLTQRVAMLWAPQEGQEPEQEVTAWLQTISAELFLSCRAGLSNAIEMGAGMERGEGDGKEGTNKGEEWALRLKAARDEAEFALEAGKRFRSQELVHRFGRLGLSRVLHGLPESVREDFLAEVLARDVAATLTQELRETVFAFLEHSMQVAETARSLFVHRNTLLYRLERIAELTGYDIRRPMHLWTLWLALTLLRTD